MGNENRQRRHERSPTDEEFRGLGRVLHEPERRGGGMEHAAMAIRLLLTGCQKNESLSLGWDNLDLEAVVRRPNLTPQDHAKSMSKRADRRPTCAPINRNAYKRYDKCALECA